MSHVLVVQHDGQKQVHKLQLSSESPISIGRAWDNDVIIDDEYPRYGLAIPALYYLMRQRQ